MRFIYEYRTSDNVLHSDIIKAASKDAAYALLKTRGIRPGRVIEAPGFFNKLFGKGKRWIVIFILFCVCATAIAYAFYWFSRANYWIDQAQDVNSQLQEAKYGALERQQIMGDRYIILEGHRNNWSDIFVRKSDRFLSRFVEPGRMLSKEELLVDRDVIDELKLTMLNSVEVKASDIVEQSQVKRIVAGIRKEMAMYVQEGGTVEEYVKCLFERQRYEQALRRKAIAELRVVRSRTRSEQSYISEWKRINMRLRSYGLKLIPISDETWE